MTTRRIKTRRRKGDRTDVSDFVGVVKSVVSAPDETASDRTKKKLQRANLLSIGSTMLDLYCTGTPYGTFLKGRYYLLVGASGAGKTWLSLTSTAEAQLHEDFKNYKVVYDNAEDGANMDIEYYFGKTAASKIRPPAPGRVDKDGNLEEHSITIENFYDSVDDHLSDAEKEGHGVLYILDSMDSLTTTAELAKKSSNKKARREGKETTGSYGDGKAKVNSTNLRAVTSRLAKSGSILIIVSQERSELSGYGGKTFSGGNALTFYATLQVWFKKGKSIVATINKKERPLGQVAKVTIKKNRLTGQNHKEVFIPIYHSFGIDNVGSMIDWLVEEGFWSGGKSSVSKITATEFDVSYGKERLVRYIEENNLEDRLKEVVFANWVLIEKAMSNKVQRKNRYD